MTPFPNRQKIQRHFYRAHACFAKYFLMTKKWQQIKKLTYVTTCGPSGCTVCFFLSKSRSMAVIWAVYRRLLRLPAGKTSRPVQRPRCPCVAPSRRFSRIAEVLGAHSPPNPSAERASAPNEPRGDPWSFGGVLRKVMIVFVIFENEKTIESFEKYDVLRLWLE